MSAAEIRDRERALAWAEGRVAEGHHRNCSTRALEGCDCYFRGGEFAAARALAAAEAERDAAYEQNAALRETLAFYAEQPRPKEPGFPGARARQALARWPEVEKNSTSDLAAARLDGQRLREALEEIESFPISGYHAGAAQRMARAALAGSGSPAGVLLTPEPEVGE